MKPDVRRIGDNWLYLWPDHGISVAVDQIRDSSDGLHAEICIRALRDGQPDGHIHWSRLNLSSTRSRADITKALQARDAGTPWAELLEAACTLTARDYRTGIEIVNLATVEAPDERAYLINRLLPRNEISMLYADGASGKSLLALALAVVCETGIALPAGIRLAGGGCKTWYLDYETNARTHARRLAWLARGLGLESPPNIAYSKMPRSLYQAADSVRAQVRDAGIGLVIVDSAAYAADGDINEAQVATRLCNALASLDTTVLLIHHLNKEGARSVGGAVKPYGSAYFFNSARNAWEIRSAHPAELTLAVSLWHRKDNDDALIGLPLGLAFKFDRAAKAVRLEGHAVAEDPELSQYGGLQYQIRALLSHAHGCLTVAELAEETGKTAKEIEHALRRSPDVVLVHPGSKGRGNAAQWGLAARGENP